MSPVLNFLWRPATVSEVGVGTIAAGVAKGKADVVLISGAIGEHGVAVMSVRDGIDFDTPVRSDTAPLHELVAEMIATSGRDIDLEVDGGLAVPTVAAPAEAGANVVVAGSAVFKDPDGFHHAISAIRDAALAARA